MMNNFLNLKIPNVVATITSVSDLEFLAQMSSEELQLTADIYEFRVDNFEADSGLDQLEAFLKTFTGLALVTPRHPSEGGVSGSFLDFQTRVAAIERFMLYASLVDIEIAQFEEVASKVEFSCPVVGSCHDFGKPIPLPILQEKIAFCHENEIDVAKFAMVMNSQGDLDPVMDLVREVIAGGQKISAMGMGSEMGPKSRISLAKAGSCLNYGFLQQENAPGQMAASEMKRLLNLNP